MTALRVVVAVLAGAVLTGCGAGFDAQTYQERAASRTTNTEVGELALRNIFVLAPEDGNVYEVGSDAEVIITVTNKATEADRLVAVTTPAAAEVVVLSGGTPGELEVPGRGSTQNEITLLLTGLTAQLHTGEFISMSFRFANNGTVEALVPVALTGSTDRPVFTGEQGSAEGEPALQGPTGGRSQGAAK